MTFPPLLLWRTILPVPSASIELLSASLTGRILLTIIFDQLYGLSSRCRGTRFGVNVVICSCIHNHLIIRIIWIMLCKVCSFFLAFCCSLVFPVPKNTGWMTPLFTDVALHTCFCIVFWIGVSFSYPGFRRPIIKLRFWGFDHDFLPWVMLPSPFLEPACFFHAWVCSAYSNLELLFVRQS